MNQVTLIGHLGRDPEIRRLENGNPVAKVSLATTEKWMDKNQEWQEHTEWHNVVLWNNAAKNAEKYLKKGKKVTIFGKNKTRKWQGKDGIDRWTTEVHSTKCVYNFEIPREGNFPSASDAPPIRNHSAANTPVANQAADTTNPANLPDAPF